MLGDKSVCGCIAVKDMDEGKKFYTETLGMKVKKETPDGGVVLQSGDGVIFIYQSTFAGTNQATAAAWNADDVASVAEELKAKGVALEHYDSIPGVKLEGDVHVFGDLKAIWFKDPSGNILNVVNQM